MLLCNFVLQLKQEMLKDASKAEQYGPHLIYKNIFLGKTDETVVEFVSGEFIKYINNNGIPCIGENNIIGQKAQCLSHFSYQRSGAKLMVV